ncbi:sporulation protein [Clostridium sporogenes]|uniref:GerW family sporulation protein n=1 Tax=Clostridium sporogenes TaxID=1509 RepID=UPI0013D056ED|nr:spore germination protein GerW family protein [Clostridium sporogenes]MBU5298857.1 sporulation protein [Clostridium sporogenes]NFP93026.1 sporulation protein [Clostridium sporogenes]
MNNNKCFDENMNAVFTKVEDYIKHENLLGAPVSVENKTLVPIVSVTLGYGSGNHSPKMNQNTTDSSPALGLGARVCTDAIMVMDNDSVSMLPVSQKNNMDKIINKIPEMVTNLKQNMGQNNQQAGSQNTAASQATSTNAPQAASTATSQSTSTKASTAYSGQNTKKN